VLKTMAAEATRNLRSVNVSQRHGFLEDFLTRQEMRHDYNG